MTSPSSSDHGTRSADRLAASNGSLGSDAEVRIQTAMEEYLAELEAGRHPQRDEFLSRYDDVALELRGQLEGLDFLCGTVRQVVDDNFPPATFAPQPNSMLGDFRIVRELGRGGMGIVYEAEQLSRGRRVALKMLHPAASLRAGSLRRFQNEALVATQLDHPNIVRLLEAGNYDGVHYHVLELVEGHSLAQVIAAQRKEEEAANESSTQNSSQSDILAERRKRKPRRKLSLANGNAEQDRLIAAARLAAQIARALHHAHERAILHRDVKPSNVLIDQRGNARLTDFGLAHQEDNTLTASGDVLGTLQYMSPEQARGDRALVDRRTDVYSLGATLYELATLQQPFFGDTRESLLLRMANEGPLPPRRVRPSISFDLETIILTAIAPEPERRYATAGDMATDLERLVARQPIHARRTSISDRTLRWMTRHKRAASLMAAGMVALSCFLTVMSLIIFKAHTKTEAALADSQRHAKHAQDLLYMADLQFAYQAWNRQRIDQVSEILNRQIPPHDEPDRRAFAWHVLHALTKQPLPMVLGRHNGAVNDIAVFSDHERMATVGDDGVLRIWHLPSQSLVKTILAADSPLHAVAVSPQMDLVATGGQLIQYWNVENGERVGSTKVFTHTVESIAFTPDGSQVAAGTRYDGLHLYTRSGDHITTVHDASRHESLAFLPHDNALLAPSRVANDVGGHDGFIRLWNSSLSKILRDFYVTGANRNQRNFTLATTSPNGKLFAFSERYQREHTLLLDADSNEYLFRLPPHRDQVNTTAFSADGKLFAAGFNDGTLDYWWIEYDTQGKLLEPFRTHSIAAHQGKLTSLQFAGTRQLVTCGTDGQILLWTLPGQHNPRWLTTPSSAMAVAPGGNRIACTGGESLVVMNQACEVLFRHDQPHAKYSRVAFSHDGRWLALVCSQRDVVELRDSHTGEWQHTIQLDSEPAVIDFAPHGSQLAVLSRSGALYLLNPQTKHVHQRRKVIDVAGGPSFTCRYSPDGKTILCAGPFNALVACDAHSLEIEKRWPVSSITNSVAFSQAGSLIASGHNDATIRLWSWPSGELRATLRGHESAVFDVEFTPDGQTIASTSKDGTTRLWSATYARECGILQRVGQSGTNVVFSPDGQRLFALHFPGAAEKTLAIFSLR